MAKTLLIVDTNPHLGYLFRRYAEESGFKALNVYQAEDLLALVRRTRPAAIVLGADLPETGSRSVLRELETEPSTHGIPVIMCSWDEDSRLETHRGIAGHVNKAMSYADFVQALERAGIKPC